MDMTVRAATEDDAAAIAEAHVRAWQVAYRGIVPQAFLDALDVEERSGHWYQNLTESALPDGTPSPANIVVEVAEKVVGFACVGVFRGEPGNRDFGELWAMYLHPDHWGIGAGYALMSATFEHFTNVSCNTGYLWVLDDNERARRFYERQGWQADPVTQQDSIGTVEITERRYSISL